MTIYGREYLVIINYYSKMPIVHKMPTSQCNSVKMITVLKELFAEHEIPEVIWSDKRPQFASHLFTEFVKDWNIKHSTSLPRNPRSNGQVKSVVEIVKSLLTHALEGSIPYFISTQENPSWFSFMIIFWDTLFTYCKHNCASKDQAQGYLCSSWMWNVRRMCNQNKTMTMWQDEQVHPHTMDQNLKILKDSALKAYLPNQWHISTIHSLSLT